MENTGDSEGINGRSARGDEWRVPPLLFLTTEKTFSESTSVHLIGAVLCAVDTEMNYTYPSTPGAPSGKQVAAKWHEKCCDRHE